MAILTMTMTIMVHFWVLCWVLGHWASTPALRSNLPHYTAA
jgi:hypothetical protein